VEHMSRFGATDAPGSPKSSPPRRTKEGPTDGRRVLVVDDCPDSAEMIATFLEMKGHETHVANDGRTAIEEAIRLVPDVAILDIGLPDVDGCEVARTLRRERPQMLLIALTGYGGDRDRVDIANAGFDAHLLKPVELGALATLLADGP
jgi:two-component system, sensor histidine kinase